MTFTVEIEQNNKISFLDVNIIPEQGKVITSIYRKPTLIVVFGYALVGQCSSTIDTFKKDISQNIYPGNFIYRCFKLFLNRNHVLKEKVPTVEKKPLRLILI